MELEELRVVFGRKIYTEYEEVKLQLLKKTKQEIYHSSYYIECMVCFYEILLEMSQQMDEAQLQSTTMCPHLLTLLYDRWLKIEDSLYIEMKSYLKESILHLERNVA